MIEASVKVCNLGFKMEFKMVAEIDIKVCRAGEIARWSGFLEIWAF